MDHSEVKCLPVDAAQLNCALDKPDNCAKKTKAPPPPIIQQVAVLPDSHWRKHYLDVCHGDHAAAELLGKIVFRYQPTSKGTARLENIRYTSDGKRAYWWGHRVEALASECGLKYEQTRYALRKLTGWGLIETRSAKTPVKMLQVRLLVAEGAASLNGWPDFGLSQIAICENSQKAICENSQMKSFKVVGGKSVEVGKVFVAASPATNPSPDFLSMQPGKDKPAPDAVVKSPKFCTASEKNSAGLLWLSLVTQYLPEHALPLKVREWKIVRDLCNRIDSMPDLPGHEPVLRWAFQNWPLWAKAIGYADQVAPDKLTTVLDTAIAAYREECTRLAEKEAFKVQKQETLKKASEEIAALQAAAAAAPKPVKKLSKIAQFVADKAAAKAIAETPEPQPEPAPALNPEPLVVHYLTADDYEECNEPPLESEKAPLTPAELRALDHAKQQARIAALKQQKFAASAATMFHGKPKHVKAALTHQASFVGHAKG